MKIFCTGLSRTGTTSLTAGLKLLGLRAVHFPFAMFGRPESIGAAPFQPQLRHSIRSRWQLHRELKALRCHDPVQVLNCHDAFADLPVPHFFRELAARYPDALFIHTTRPIEPWMASMEWLLERGRHQRGWTVGPLTDEMHFAIYGCVRYNEAALRDAFARHENAVREHFKDEHKRLLALDISKGEMCFENIAPFVGLAVPNAAFPSENAKSEAYP
jgi:hypothetical protein